ncbi:NYN domain-containing protein [Volucribacter amazonae]|uniref:HTH OST-type domain-containing protein n=1 Tax=Volucribacter amazonae TaxID=256731 RepID=A0A9X4SLC1_9PAST|nr:NYN domain-containing protein [Volucribacter amazonae]MDG6896009.1 hypothetical protein [Volucribacter amazonae]
MLKNLLNKTSTSISLAVLIDDGNISIKYIEVILNEINKLGNPIIKRVYGNFIGKNDQWKEIINKYAIKPIQQFEYTKGKNATDCFMIIDAMDLLYQYPHIQGFCIVSSDSDFTSLAIRLKEQGMYVYGFGMEKTPKAFRYACTRFINVEHLFDISINNEKIIFYYPTQSVNQIKIEKVKQQLKKNLPENHWIQLGLLGKKWREIDPKFTPKNYGFKKLSTLVKEYHQIFDCKIIGNNQFYIKLKK